ncbi:hypothetical protein EC973_004114, partial [Apophysomyces ossiformis]
MNSALHQQGLDSIIDFSDGSQRLFHVIDNRTKRVLFSWPSATQAKDFADAANLYDTLSLISNASCFQCTQQTLRPTHSRMIDRLVIPYGCITFASIHLSDLQASAEKQRLRRELEQQQQQQQQEEAMAAAIPQPQPQTQIQRRESIGSDNSNGTDNSEGHTCLTETHPETGPTIPYARRASSISQPYLVRSTRSLSSPTTARRVASSRNIRDRYSPPAAHKNICESCGTDSSPEWRRGPSGHKT